MIAFLLWAGALLAGIATAGAERRLPRLAYAWRVAALFAAGLLSAYASQAAEPVGDGALALLAGLSVVILVLCFLGARWSAHRLNHIGWPRWWALSLLIPAVNLLALIGLCLIPSRRRETPVTDPAD